MKRGWSTDEGVELAGAEGAPLQRHGLGVEVGERVGGAAEGRVQRAVRLVHPRRRLRLPLPRHRRRRRRGIRHRRRQGRTLG